MCAWIDVYLGSCVWVLVCGSCVCMSLCIDICSCTYECFIMFYRLNLDDFNNQAFLFIWGTMVARTVIIPRDKVRVANVLELTVN